MKIQDSKNNQKKRHKILTSVFFLYNRNGQLKYFFMITILVEVLLWINHPLAALYHFFMIDKDDKENQKTLKILMIIDLIRNLGIIIFGIYKFFWWFKAGRVKFHKKSFICPASFSFLGGVFFYALYLHYSKKSIGCKTWKNFALAHDHSPKRRTE